MTEDGITTTYIYFGADTLYEENSTGSAAHIYGPTGRIAKRTTINQESNIYYYHTDHLGSTRLVTDSSKNIVSAITYHPFGESYSEEGSENYLFNGKEKDATGLYYYGARYYDPELGRFLTRDPLGGALLSPQSLNRYTYCLNNPLKYVDPTGLNSRFSKDDEARADGKDEERKNRAKKHPPKQFHWAGDGGPPPIPTPGGRDRFIVFVTGIFWNNDGTMGIAVACIASPVNSRFTSDSWAIHDFGLVILFFDKDGNILDLYFVSFKDLEDNMKEIWEEIKELLEEYGVSEEEFKDVLFDLTTHLDSIIDALHKVGGGCIFIGFLLLRLPNPFSWMFGGTVLGFSLGIWIDSGTWDRWKDILILLEHMD
ncbi:MAG: RHS domain-containing protein [Theionarchaea archaeon]|nr:RHS domain-containing protein [Theionarchaea archaeon]